MESKIYSYILRFDDGAAPNPFWDTCTLAICKPIIRRTAEVGNWVIGTGSKHSRCNDGKEYDLSQCLVYAMKISYRMTLAEYNNYCSINLLNKIPNPGAEDWRMRMGDCIYFDAGNEKLDLRPDSIHKIEHRDRDLRGVNVLLSTDYYYFGENAVIIPQHLTRLIKKNQGHLKIEDAELIEQFEIWIRSFEQNKLYGNPQMMSEFDKPNCRVGSHCSRDYNIEDENEIEETISKC